MVCKDLRVDVSHLEIFQGVIGAKGLKLFYKLCYYQEMVNNGIRVNLSDKLRS